MFKLGSESDDLDHDPPKILTDTVEDIEKFFKTRKEPENKITKKFLKVILSCLAYLYQISKGWISWQGE